MERDEQYLLDILDSAELALEYVAGERFEKFMEDVRLQDAAIRRLEIMGEAAGRVSISFRQAPPEVPWSGMVGMRNVLVHQYGGINLAIVWETIKRQLPGVIEQIQKILSEK